MGERTGIAWTDATWNPIRGCSRVSEGCRNCYAERIAARFSDVGKPFEGFASIGPRRGAHGWTGKVALVPEKLEEPLHWRKPRRVFVNSMSDLFHEKLANEDIAAVFGVMAGCPQISFQVLTKRPERMLEWFAWAADSPPISALARCVVEAENRLRRWPVYQPAFRVPWPLPNVWLGVSVEDQRTADERIPMLLEVPAVVRFVSYEPALGPVDCGDFFGRYREIGAKLLAIPDWLIVGGESGPKARPFNVAWARSAIRQCRDAGVPVFMKQLGANPVPLSGMRLESFNALTGRRHRGWIDDGPHAISDPAGADPSEWPIDLRVREFPEVAHG